MGTRFQVFTQPGVFRDPFKKFQDAAEVHRYTGICPSVAIHIPWDEVPNVSEFKQYAESLGMRIGAVNPNLFQEQEYMPYCSWWTAKRLKKRNRRGMSWPHIESSPMLVPSM